MVRLGALRMAGGTRRTLAAVAPDAGRDIMVGAPPTAAASCSCCAATVAAGRGGLRRGRAFVRTGRREAFLGTGPETPSERENCRPWCDERQVGQAFWALALYNP